MQTTNITNYRESHLHRGSEYHAEFTENPRRSLIWKLEQQVLTQIPQRFLPNREINHLDFACGTGRILELFSSHVHRSTGVDLSPSMLEVAKSNVPQARFVEADLTREDALAGEHFDLITAFRFFPNAEQELREEAITAHVKLLKPGGYLVFNNHRNTYCIAYRVARMLGKSKELEGMPRHEAHQLIKYAGLQIRKVYHIGIIPEYETRYLRPRWLMMTLEKMGTYLPVERLSENLIYVCKKPL